MASKDSVSRTMLVALVLCVICSVVVSTAAVLLKDKQQLNAANEKKANILSAADIDYGDDLEGAFAKVTPKLVEMSTGKFSNAFDVTNYDDSAAAKDPALSIALAGNDDIASIRRQAKYRTVYLIEGDAGIEKIILPVHGYGLWSTLYGFVALEGDLNTIVGLGFYSHGETPGLGGEVDNPRWKSVWQGKQVYDAAGTAKIGLIKGVASASDKHAIDGLAGATLTSNGVTNLVRFWMGENGFTSFLANLKAGEA